MMPTVSAVLFAKDARRVAEFYRAVFAARQLAQDEYHSALEMRGFRLVVHQIPAHLMKDVEIGDPPSRREWGAIRLDYPIGDLVKARNDARRLGGQIDEAPPAWADEGSRFRLGFDPEGNVFGVKEESG